MVSGLSAEIIGVFKTLSPTDLLMFVSWVKRHQREFGEDLAVQSCDNKHEADRKRDKEHGRSEEERGAAAVKAESEGQASEVHLAHLRVERVSKMDERARSSLVSNERGAFSWGKVVYTLEMLQVVVTISGVSCHPSVRESTTHTGNRVHILDEGCEAVPCGTDTASQYQGYCP